MKKDEVYIIESRQIKKSLTFHRGRLEAIAIENKLSGTTYSSYDCSEEFILAFKWGFLGKNTIKASELSLESYDNNGEEHIFTFEPFKVADNKLLLKLIYRADSCGCLKKHLELSYASRGSKDVILDYIDLEGFFFDAAVPFWCVPSQADSHIKGEVLELGQPVYVGSLFFGVEFPVSYNTVENGGTTLRTYNGRSILALLGDGVYKSRTCVIGGAESDNSTLLQKAFFDYIDTVARPAKLRRQYNSWYDHRLDIFDENLTESFLEIEKALTNIGEPPLDSFVADDGWNDYTKGFWSFNSRFPNELYPMRDICEAFGSRFGLWLGPRGGYTNDTPKFAKHIEAAGNGYYNRQAQDICVASDKYHQRTTELLLDYQRRFNLGYWKLDGFARLACKSKNHDHLIGGFRNMYFFNDVWEKWLTTLDKLHNEGEDLWINLTCYAWPSPWFLMHAECLWMQVSDDHGFVGKKGEVKDKDRVITYRDGRYFDFCRDRQFQFPLSRLYNHDPIYANEAGFTMSDDEFREYLFINAMRGTRFWELYYSFDLMNEAKWRINYSALRFAEDNCDTLYAPVAIGARPEEGKVYGFACFDTLRGIVALRNSGSAPQEYTLSLDEKTGVPKGFVGGVYQLLPYKAEGKEKDLARFGDTFKVNLAPYQTKIYCFGLPKKYPEVSSVRVVSENTVEVTFNQFMNPEAIACLQLPILKTELLADYMTLRITFDGIFDRENSLKLTGISDIFGRECDGDISFAYYEDNIVTEGIIGNMPFTIRATLDDDTAKSLYSQGEDVSLSVGDDGYIHFRAGLTVLKSKAMVKDIVQAVAVRERNGVLKLYLNGKLDSGTKGIMYPIKGQKGIAYDENRVVVYSKALAYDEV